MTSKPLKTAARAPYKPQNKLKRQELHLRVKRARESSKRDEKFRRKREEDKNPRLREERRRRNVPLTLERKRTWDEAKSDDELHLGVSVDLERAKRHRSEAEEQEGGERTPSQDRQDNAGVQEEDRDSMLDSDSELDDGADESTHRTVPVRPDVSSDSAHGLRASSPTVSSISTRLDLTPAALAAKFPTLFSTEAAPIPKILVTTSLNSTLHDEAQLLTTLFPNAVYIRRSAHRYGHKFSVREIAKFASNRKYTALVVLREDQKEPTGLTVVHLPAGPSFYFSISNWIEGKKLPGHGNPTSHIPELILNNFRTPLGLITAHLFRSIFPPQPDLQGRQVVTLHNQRDYIFVRRHRYVFREKRPTEKTVVGPDGKEMRGAEGIRAGLQELGPRFTLKLRRIDTGVGRAGSNGQVEWEWRGSMEKQRTKFQL